MDIEIDDLQIIKLWRMINFLILYLAFYKNVYKFYINKLYILYDYSKKLLNYTKLNASKLNISK